MVLRESSKDKIFNEIVKFLKKNEWDDGVYIYYKGRRYDIGKSELDKMVSIEDDNYSDSGFMAVTYDGGIFYSVMDGEFGWCSRNLFEEFMDKLLSKYEYPRYNVSWESEYSWCFKVYSH